MSNVVLYNSLKLPTTNELVKNHYKRFHLKMNHHMIPQITYVTRVR